MTRYAPTSLLLLVLAVGGCGDDDSTTGADEDMGPADSGIPMDMPPVPTDEGPPPITECTAATMGSTVGTTCSRDLHCNDACFCNGTERCMEGVCIAGSEPCGATECSTGVCDEATDTCDETPDDSLCDDEVFCNGAERCDPSAGCLPGVPPFCADGDICTVDFCDEGTTACVFEILDQDMDGTPAISCGGGDCDDTSAARSPTNTEICGNGIDDDCNFRADLRDPACVLTNDSCDPTGGRGPMDITRTTDGTSVVEGSTFGMAGDYNVSCTTSTLREGGPDAVFQFTLTETKDVVAEIQGVGPDAVVEIRPLASCATEAGNLACSAPSSLQPYAFARSVPVGDYAIVVITEEEAPFTLAFTVAPPTAAGVPNDACDTTMLDISGGGTFMGDYDGDPRYSGDEFSDRYDLPCRSTTTAYAEVAFRLTVPAGELRDVTLEGFTSSSTGSGRAPYLALVDSCTAPSIDVRYCEEAPSSGSAAVIDVRNLPEGTYYVLLEEDFSSDRGWSLQANIRPSTGGDPGDSCFAGNPVDITSGPGMVDLSTAQEGPNEGAFCRANGPAAKDVYFSFTLATESEVTVDTTSTVRHTAAVSSECGVVPSALACYSALTGTGTTTYGRLPAGTYYLNVTTLEAAGVITAEVTTVALGTPPANDVCSSATTLTAGMTSVDLGAYTDAAAYCGATGRYDAYYTLDLATDQRVTLQALNAQSLVVLAGDCTGTETCVAGPSAIFDQVLTAGTYTVVVEADPLAARSDVALYLTTTDP